MFCRKSFALLKYNSTIYIQKLCYFLQIDLLHFVRIFTDYNTIYVKINMLQLCINVAFAWSRTHIKVLVSQVFNALVMFIIKR